MDVGDGWAGWVVAHPADQPSFAGKEKRAEKNRQYITACPPSFR